MKTLVVYYSLTGHTKGIAEAIAGELSADIEQIKDMKSRAGRFVMFWSGRDALFKRPGLIQPTQKEPCKYDLVVLGTPVWAWAISSPVRAYIMQHASSLKQVAFFCTEGGSGGKRAFGQMGELIGKQPVATLEVTESDLKTGADNDKLKPFVDAIGQLSASSEPTREASLKTHIR